VIVAERGDGDRCAHGYCTEFHIVCLYFVILRFTTVREMVYVVEILLDWIVFFGSRQQILQNC
jgi:hypothetical protein